MYMQQSFLQKTLTWRIRNWQLLLFLAFYIFFAFQYWLALYFTTHRTFNPWKEIIIDYSLKLLLTIPVWWLHFVKWRNRPIKFRLAMHLITEPLWVAAWFYGYRLIQDFRGELYLKGTVSFWDVYIPSLIYIIQFGIFHLYDFYRQTKEQKQKEKDLMQAALNSEVNALKAQIQPHFLFNTLNSISASVPKEMEHTRELIAKLADTFRFSLKASNEEWITLEDELNFTRITLELEKERLKKRLDFAFDVDKNLLQTKIPPMLLQPITENAIKHGIAPKIEGGTITITVKKVDDKVHISITDTGIGYQDEEFEAIFSKGIGLRNTNQRLEKLFGEKILVTKNNHSGLRFSFNIPL